MSYSNIVKGYYDASLSILPETIMSDDLTLEIFSPVISIYLTSKANISLTGNILTLQVDNFNTILNGTISENSFTFSLPNQFTLPTSGINYGFPITLAVNNIPEIGIITINVSSGLISISRNGATFNSGDVVGIRSFTYTYLLC